MPGTAASAPLLHGGRLAEASRAFPDAPHPLLDLSTGINPHPYPVPVVPAGTHARLPDPDALDALLRVAAAAYGAAGPELVAAAPGSQVLIGLLPRLWPARHVRVLGPTYAEHAAAWRAAGATVRETTQLNDLSEADCAVLCCPNNPDGRRIGADRLLALADRLAARGGLLVVDEAFADFEPPSGLPHSLQHPALLVLRSFGKAYGLAGLRLGFALAAPERIAALRAVLGPWPVCGLALATGLAALADRDWLHDTGLLLRREADRLDRLLAAAGLAVIGGTCLFRLARHEDAATIHHRLGRAGIMVRRFPDRPDRLRFGLPGDEAGWARLESALA